MPRRLRARTVADSTLGPGFLCVSDFVFDTGRTLVDPAAEALARRYRDVKRLHLQLRPLTSYEGCVIYRRGRMLIGHGHAHTHAHAAEGIAVRRALMVALVLNGFFLFVEAGVGWWTQSLALLSDAAHMLSDVGALALALGASHLATLAASPTRSFGLRRAETMGAFINGLTLLAASAWIFWEAIERLLSGPPSIPGLPVLVVGAIGLLVNLASAWYLARASTDNLNVRGALIHMLADALGSVGAVVAALFVMAGHPIADPITSLFIGALVVWGTWGLLRDSGRVLLQFAPPHIDPEDVRRSLLDIGGVVGVHDLHVWTLDGTRAVMSAHLELGAGAIDAAVRRDAQRVLSDEWQIGHATLQLEPLDECAGGACEIGTFHRGDAHDHDHGHDHDVHAH